MPPKKTSATPKKPGLKKVRILVRLEEARDVAVTGDFTRWSTEGLKLSKCSDNEWLAQIDLPPGEYQYRLIVDGQWRDDPNAPKRVPNPFGSENCVLMVS